MFEGIAVKLFGRLIEPYLDYFDELKVNLKRANMRISIYEYLSKIVFFAFLGFAAAMFAGSVFITLLLPPDTLSLIYSYTTSVLISLAFAAIVFSAGYYYPRLRSKAMGGKINRAIPFAAFYMATSASSGINPTEIFRLLSVRGGVVGKEAERIYTDVTTLGMRLTDALQRAAMRSSSVQFADLLWGLSSTINSGGDLEAFLKGKTRSFMSQYRRSLEEYSQQIALFTEIYITLVIVGSLFFIILIAIISPLGAGNTLLIQTFLVFFMIPLVSIGFIFLLRGMSPTE